jgi:hypothetical protein
MLQLINAQQGPQHIDSNVYIHSGHILRKLSSSPNSCQYFEFSIDQLFSIKTDSIVHHCIFLTSISRSGYRIQQRTEVDQFFKHSMRLSEL